MDALIDFCMEPLSYAFMQRGLLAAILIGIVAAVIGAFVVLRGMSFIGDAMAHAVLPGVAIAFLVGQNVLLGAFLAGTATAVGIGFVKRSSHLREDSAIGIMFVGAFALGIALLSRTRSYTVDLNHILFGNVLAVSPQDLWIIAAFGAAVLIVLALLYKELLVMSFDPIMAATARLPVTLLNDILLILLSVTIVISMRAVGNILVVAMLIAPAATAYLLTDHLPRMMALGAAFGVAAAVIGLYISYWFDVASGAAIVLAAVAIFFVTLLATRARHAWG